MKEKPASDSAPVPVALVPPPLVLFNLRALYLRSSSTNLDEAFDPLKGGQQLVAAFDSAPLNYFVTGEIAKDGVTQVPQSYTFVTRYEFRYTLGDQTPTDDVGVPSEGKEVASIRADIAVDYVKNPQGPEPTAEYIRAWNQGQPLLHSWPYWREFCHSSMSRMNLPVVLMPMMVVQHPSPAIAHDNQFNAVK